MYLCVQSKSVLYLFDKYTLSPDLHDLSLTEHSLLMLLLPLSISMNPQRGHNINNAFLHTTNPTWDFCYKGQSDIRDTSLRSKVSLISEVHCICLYKYFVVEPRSGLSINI